MQRKISIPAALSVLAVVSVSAALAMGMDSARSDAGPVRATTMPDTTAAALWSHLEAEDYAANWDLWPGTEQLYEGTEPHGMLLTTYVNSKAAAGLEDGRLGDLPAGSIVVKENYKPDGTLVAVTVMMRVPEYNPDHQDWLFAKYGVDGAAEAFGRVPMCQSCHSAAESGAYLDTPIE